MTLAELSLCYEAAAVPLRVRLAQLRRQLAQTQDPEEIFRLKRRILELTPMLTEMNELAELTARLLVSGAAELSVPLVVDVGVGKTWYEAK